MSWTPKKKQKTLKQKKTEKSAMAFHTRKAAFLAFQKTATAWNPSGS